MKKLLVTVLIVLGVSGAYFALYQQGKKPLIVFLLIFSYRLSCRVRLPRLICFPLSAAVVTSGGMERATG